MSRGALTGNRDHRISSVALSRAWEREEKGEFDTYSGGLSADIWIMLAPAARAESRTLTTTP